MRIVKVDDVIDAMRSEYNNGTKGGIDYDQTDMAAFEELLEQVWKEKGWSIDPELVRLCAEDEECERMNARNKTQ